MLKINARQTTPEASGCGAGKVLCLTWIGLGIDLVGSRVLPVELYRWTLRSFDVTTQTELLQGFKGSRMKHLLKSKAET